MKINHQELIDGFCKYFEEEKIKRQKIFGFCDKYLEGLKNNAKENLKNYAKTFDNVKSSSKAMSKGRE